jgi:hypothetical protein
MAEVAPLTRMARLQSKLVRPLSNPTAIPPAVRIYSSGMADGSTTREDDQGNANSDMGTTNN